MTRRLRIEHHKRPNATEHEVLVHRIDLREVLMQERGPPSRDNDDGGWVEDNSQAFQHATYAIEKAVHHPGLQSRNG